MAHLSFKPILCISRTSSSANKTSCKTNMKSTDKCKHLLKQIDLFEKKRMQKFSDCYDYIKKQGEKDIQEMKLLSDDIFDVKPGTTTTTDNVSNISDDDVTILEEDTIDIDINNLPNHDDFFENETETNNAK